MKKLLIILLSMQILFAVEVQELKKGDTVEDSVERLEKKYYKVGVQNGKSVEVKLTKLTSDVDLYIRMEKFDWDKKEYIPVEENIPSIRKNDCYSSNSNREEEICTYQMHGPAPGDYDVNTYILVYGFKAGSYQLEVKEIENEKIDTLPEVTTKGKVKKGESKQYRIYGVTGETISVSIYDLTADVDLRLKIGRKANRHNFDCKSINGGTKADSCSVTLKENGYVYVHVDGYRSASYSIKKGKIADNDSILLQAKEQCLEKDNSTSTILCSNEENIVYMVDREDFGYEVKFNYYHIDITPNREKIISTNNYSLSGNANGNASVSFIKLEDTTLFLMKTISPTVDYMGGFKLLNRDKALLTIGFYEDGDVIDSIKTIDSGKKLELIYHNNWEEDKPYKVRKVYDISDLNRVKLLSETRLDY